MGNCLVTKLKGTVDNNNLSRFGTLVFNVDTVGNGSNDKYVAAATTTVFSASDGLVIENRGSNSAYLKPGTSGLLLLKPKYDITSLTVNQKLINTNIEQFGSTPLVSITFNYDNETFDLGKLLEVCPTLKYIQMPSIQFTGSPVNIALISDLTTIFINTNYQLRWIKNTSVSQPPTPKRICGDFGNTLSALLIDMAATEDSLNEFLLYGTRTNSAEELAAIEALKPRLSNFWINGVSMKA